jgi:hypothetical protein
MISILIETNYYFASSVYLQPFNFDEDTGSKKKVLFAKSINIQHKRVLIISIRCTV